MLENKPKEKFNIHINLDDSTAASIQSDSFIEIDGDLEGPIRKHFRVTSIEPFKKSLADVIIKDLKILYKAIFIPLKNTAARSKLIAIALIYSLLTPSGVSFFFVRGWRFEIVKRMIKSEQGQAIAPTVSSLDELGFFIRDGIRLFGAKALYDLPKIIILTAFGYSHIEFILDLLYRFFIRLPGVEDFQSDLESSAIKFSTTLGIQLLFFIVASFIITPTFKISMMKYATGKITYFGFFSITELKDSFRIYRKYKTKTLTTYVWDSLVSSLSLLIGFMLIFMFPFIFWLLIPMYKLLFKHWPKAYGYGQLARRLAANGEI